MRTMAVWTYSICLLLCYFGAIRSEQQNGKKSLYIMHLNREKVSSYNYRHMTQFLFDAVNNDTTILPGYTIHAANAFTSVSNDIGNVVKNFMTYTSNGPTKIMVIGTTYTAEAKVIAEVAPVYNLMQISYYVTSPELSDTTVYPSFIRMGDSTALRNPAMVKVLKYYNWTNVAIVKQNKAHVLPASDNLVTLLKKENITHTVLMFETAPTYVIRQIKESAARIVIVFAGHAESRHVMCEVHKQKLSDERYQWLFWSIMDYTNLAEDKFDAGCSKQQVIKVCDRLIAFDTEEPSTTYENEVIGDSGYTTTQLRQRYSDYLDVNGYPQSLLKANAFDAVWAAAKALHASIDGLQPNETLDQFSYDNERMAKLFYDSIKNLQFQGASGHISFDDNGDRIDRIMVHQHTVDGGSEQVGLYDPADSSLTWSNTIAVRFPGDSPPPDTEIPLTEALKVDNALYWIVTCITILAIVFSLLCIAFNVHYKHLTVIKQSSPIINILIAVGCLMSLLFVIFSGADNDEDVGSNSLCSVRIFFIVIGFAFAYGGLFSKTWKVHVKYSDKTWVVRDTYLAALTGLIVALNVILVIIWQISDTLEVQSFTISEEIQENGGLLSRQVYKCTSEHDDEWIVGLCWFNALFLIAGVLFAWETRKVEIEDMNDSQAIGKSIFVITVLSIACVPIYRLIPIEERNWAFGVTSIIVLVCAVTTLLLVFGPKIHFVATAGTRVNDRSSSFLSHRDGPRHSTTVGETSITNGDGGI